MNFSAKNRAVESIFFFLEPIFFVIFSVGYLFCRNMIESMKRLIPHHNGLHLLVELLLCGVKSSVAGRAAYWRLGLYITLATYATG